MKSYTRWLLWIAPLLMALSVIGFGMASPDYSQQWHPVSLLGARGEPNAWAFNVLGFLLPGAMMAMCAIGWRSALANAPWTQRIGAQLLLLSAVAFAGQGVLPLDPDNLLAPPSRMHALAWTLWWMAFVPGALLLGLRSAQARPPLRMLLIALLVPAVAVFGSVVLPPGLAQRLAFALWFAWWLLARGNMAARNANVAARAG